MGKQHPSRAIPYKQTIPNEPYLPASHLSARQILAIPILAASPNRRQAAHDAGISESTLYRWLRDEHFLLELNRLTAEVADLTHHELNALLLRSYKVLTDLMEDPDPIVRLRAARTVAYLGIRISGAEVPFACRV